MTAAPAKLPRDLQERLDVILAKPVLRRVPLLRQSIEILVRNAYERRPLSALTWDQRVLLEQLQAGGPAADLAVPDPNQDGAL